MSFNRRKWPFFRSDHVNDSQQLVQSSDGDGIFVKLTDVHHLHQLETPKMEEVVLVQYQTYHQTNSQLECHCQLETQMPAK